MNNKFAIMITLATVFGLPAIGSAQADDMCREFGVMPSLDSPFAQVPYVFGRVAVKGLKSGSKIPRVTVVFIDRNQTEKRQTIETSGNYCFRRSGSGGTILIEVDGVETARRSLPSFGATQQREDFEIVADAGQISAAPTAISAKFSHPRNEKTDELYRKVIEAEKDKDIKAAMGLLKEIVSADPADFIAWAKLGSLYFEQNSLDEADAAFRKALALKVEYTPAWINVGKLRIAQKQPEAAIEILKHAASLEPTSARIFKVLGETYLQTQQGTLAVEALNQAIKLDPTGMADCHLLIGRLYDAAGAKKLATKEFKAFLGKVPDYAERKTLEKYIADNPE